MVESSFRDSHALEFVNPFLLHRVIRVIEFIRVNADRQHLESDPLGYAETLIVLVEVLLQTRLLGHDIYVAIVITVFPNCIIT